MPSFSRGAQGKHERLIEDGTPFSNGHFPEELERQASVHISVASGDSTATVTIAPLPADNPPSSSDQAALQHLETVSLDEVESAGSKRVDVSDTAADADLRPSAAAQRNGDVCGWDKGDKERLVSTSEAQLQHLIVKKGVSDEQVGFLEGYIQGSPFLDLAAYRFTAYEAVKIVVMFPWLIGRVLIFLVVAPCLWAYLAFLLRGTKLEEPLSPATSRRVRWALRFWSMVLLKLGCNFWCLKVKGMEHMQTAEDVRAILVYNHVAWMDPIVLVALFAPCGVAKAGVAKIPFFGTFAKALRFIFVERKGMNDPALQAQAAGTAPAGPRKHVGGGAALVKQRAANAQYPLIMIAPEGTTKSAGCLLKFSTGAFIAGQPVAPILFKYTAKHCHPGWGRYPILWHMLRLFSQFQNYVEVEVCPPYMPSAEEQGNPQLYAENVRRVMAEKLGYPLVDQGLPELVTLSRAGVTISWRGDGIVVAGEKRPRQRVSEPRIAADATIPTSLPARS